MADCCIFARAAGARYGEENYKNLPCGISAEALVYELGAGPPQPAREAPVLVRD